MSTPEASLKEENNLLLDSSNQSVNDVIESIANECAQNFDNILSKEIIEKNDNLNNKEENITEDSSKENDDHAENEINKNDEVTQLVKKEPNKRGRKRKNDSISNDIPDNDNEPDVLKEEKKKRAVELKLKNLKWTLNQSSEVSGKRKKKVPQRFELNPVDKRKSFLDNCQGDGEPLGNIPWICQQLRTASLYTLRLLHRTIYRKQGMFSEKHIRKSVLKFSGFPFDAADFEIARRKEQLEKSSINALASLCDLLGVKCGTKVEMVEGIISFLVHPTQERVDEFLREVIQEKSQPNKTPQVKRVCLIQDKLSRENILEESGKILPSFEMEKYSFYQPNMDIMNGPWKKPLFFSEGNGIKLKYIRAVMTNIQAASEAFIELLHRLLYLNVDEKHNMRRNILEFSGLRCEIGTNNYVYRTRILSVLPIEQIKLICRVLCLPTWHRSRQLLTEGIMDFLAAPRISAMKKRVPPHFSDEITFSYDTVQKLPMPDLKSAETEEIEIVPDIHLPDDSSNALGDMGLENEYLGVKLKNFSNIHYQVISTPAIKLNDVHMILYLKHSAQNNIRKNILEFSGFPFEEFSSEYECRRKLMDQMSLEDLKVVATVLCVSQYIADNSKCNIIEAVLKFLLKPSALLNSSTIMPTISPAPSPKKISLIPKKPPAPMIIPNIIDKCKDIIITKCTGNDSESKEIKITSVTSVSTCPTTISPLNTEIKSILSPLSKSKPEIKKTSSAEIKPEKLNLAAAEIKPEKLNRTAAEIKPEKLNLATAEIKPEKLNLAAAEIKPEKLNLPAAEIKPEIKTQPVNSHEIKKIQDKLSNDIQITHLTPEMIKKEVTEIDEPLSKVKNSASITSNRVPYFGSDDEEDQPLSKLIGHPNDDQLRALISKIMKESKLEDITMKIVIRRVFDTYPNYDLGYRKEFIKSIVRQILSQMDDQNCSVSTTVITI